LRALLLILLSLPAAVLAAPADLDPSFDGDGRVLTDFGGFDRPFEVVRQPDGKLVAQGQLATWQRLVSICPIQLDNKLVAAGPAAAVDADNQFGPADFLVARFNSDGSLESFNTFFFPRTSNDIPYKVTVQPDLKLVIAGVSNSNGTDDLALFRLNPDLSIDTGFGDLGGGRLVDLGGGGETARDLVVQPDGKLALAGSSSIGEDIDFVAARFNSNGSSDTGFGSGGVTRTSFGSPSVEGAFGLVREPDGRLVAAGTRMPPATSTSRWRALRLRTRHCHRPRSATAGRLRLWAPRGTTISGARRAMTSSTAWAVTIPSGDWTVTTSSAAVRAAMS
jgi:uncharacterized delta-60 repeat protein